MMNKVDESNIVTFFKEFELNLSKLLYKKYGLIVDEEVLREEDARLNRFFYKFLDKNTTYAYKLYETIFELASNNKKFFKIGPQDFNFAVSLLFSCIIHSKQSYGSYSIKGFEVSMKTHEISRQEFMSNVRNLVKKYSILGIVFDLEKIVLKTLQILEKNKFIMQTLIRELKQPKSKKVQTVIILKFNYENKILNLPIYKLDYSLNIPKIYGNYSFSACYLSILRVQNKAYYNNSNNTIPNSGIVAANSVRFVIDKKMCKILTHILTKKLDISLNKNISQNNIEENIRELLKSVTLKKISIKEHYSNAKKEVTTFDKSLIVSLYKDIDNVNKQIENLYEIMLVYTISIIEKPFYLIHFKDFRGRQYSKSILSPTYSKILRSIYTYGSYSNSEIEVIKKSLCNNFFYKKLLSKSSYLKKYYTKNNLIDYILIQYFIELGKINKSKLLKECFISLKEFIEEGIHIYENPNELDYDLYDYIEISKFCLKIKDILKNKAVREKVILNKDITASVNQNMGIFLEFKDKNYLKFCNLGGDL